MIPASLRLPRRFPAGLFFGNLLPPFGGGTFSFTGFPTAQSPGGTATPPKNINATTATTSAATAIATMIGTHGLSGGRTVTAAGFPLASDLLDNLPHARRTDPFVLRDLPIRVTGLPPVEHPRVPFRPFPCHAHSHCGGFLRGFRG